ncbi:MULTISPECIES: PAS domain-containing sensor histidine kinase [Actinoplanes]|uniref:sensor histidine kinase n=1 Tax=Actinoplanes TaxID=1865 RepID=UPI000A803CD6|nr:MULTISPECIES: PAS domain-containing sensor histidine kinase [Actinoplanes]GLY06756.1 hypothetical protein Acsp01_71350 [Actinoplanes sp. NBRC 101535]
MQSVSAQLPPVVEALVQHVECGVLIAADDVVVTANPAFLQLFGAMPDELAGLRIDEIADREALRNAPDFWTGRHAAHGHRHRHALPGDRVIEGRWHLLPSGGPRLVAAVITDLTAEVQVRHRMREHNRALAELAATKTELVSALLHELRTPLAAAMAMVGLLPERTADPMVNDALPTISRNLRRIEHAATEIATISSIECGATEMADAPFDLPTMLIEVATEAGVPVDTRPGAGEVTGDRTRLVQVFRRLLSAARALGGEPRVDATADGHQWCVGLRLPSHLPADQLFTAGGPGGNATALMLARAVVGRHGGEVRVETFGGTPYLMVRLPRATAV